MASLASTPNALACALTIGLLTANGREGAWGGTSASATADTAGEPSSWAETISWHPRAQLYHNFLSPAECSHIRHSAAKQAQPPCNIPFWSVCQMRRSTVVGADGSSVVDPVRTSYGAFIRRRHDPVVEAIEARLAMWTHLPFTHQEDMQILRYARNEKYSAHYDSLTSDGSPRVATVLMYLNDDPRLEGGETAFPAAFLVTVEETRLLWQYNISGVCFAPQNSQWAHEESQQRLGPVSECARGQVAVKPKRGDALLFWSLSTNQTHDLAAMHTGCPVLEGVKWTATKWIHSDKFHVDWLEAPREAQEAPDPGQCVDTHPKCGDWAKQGECDKNSAFMRGEGAGFGSCRRSCQACEVCRAGDRVCEDRNRLQGGYLPLGDLSDEV